jgi:hypothetical protein
MTSNNGTHPTALLAAVILTELEHRLDELLVWLADRRFFFADRSRIADLASSGQMRMAWDPVERVAGPP